MKKWKYKIIEVQIGVLFSSFAKTEQTLNDTRGPGAGGAI
jgi:hypothetical protein